MGGMTRHQHRAEPERTDGFSLIEVMVAMLVLSIALLSLVGVFTMSLQRMRASTPMLVAREKAREAIESVHAARDTGEFAWTTILNVADGGVFLNGAQPVRRPGLDGLVNTADDGAVETMNKPGADGILGNSDDEVVTLNDFTRQIDITPLNIDGTGTINRDLRQVTVTIRYRVDNGWRTYRLVSYVSSYS
jgi:prepilin-type N-terminal cleavage/methylation domain-containing protein